MSELIEMPYDNGKSLALEFIKNYSEVQLDVEIDEAVGSRIVEMSGDYFINIGHDTKKNYRLRGII